MNAAGLETLGLCKSFGALPVASDINFRLESGARHALIGPNGAGKTSFINLVTGVLAPSAGRILLCGEDITRMSRATRVKRGLVRTFQISALFRRLSLIENVTLAIAEREGTAGDLMRPAGRYRQVIDEGYALLESLGLAEDALRPVNELAYGRQRLADIAVSLAFRSWSEAAGSTVQLFLNVILLIVVGTTTLSVQQRFWRGRSRAQGSER